MALFFDDLLLHDIRLVAVSVFACGGVWSSIFLSKAAMDTINSLRNARRSSRVPRNTSPWPEQMQFPRFLKAAEWVGIMIFDMI